MARYKRWMNGKVYAAAGKLSATERRRDRGAFFKSIDGTPNHILLGDSLWIGRFEDQAFDFHGLDQELHANFIDLGIAREAIDTRIAVFVDRLAPQWFAGPFEYARLSGSRVRVDGFAALTNLFNHQTHHRGQVCTLLSQARVDPGDTDIVAMPDIQRT